MRPSELLASLLGPPACHAGGGAPAARAHHGAALGRRLRDWSSVADEQPPFVVPPRPRRGDGRDGHSASSYASFLGDAGGGAGDGTAAGSKAAARDEGHDRWDVRDWRRGHNYSLDRGMKFGIAYRSPVITGTNLFDLERWGCHKRVKKKWGIFKGLQKLFDKTDRKEWWEHPWFKLGGRYGRISVRLQDLTSGELKWDAVYDLGQAPHKEKRRFDESEDPLCDKGPGTRLCPKEKPVGGSHPFFVPDWCPAPNDAMAHRYRLSIRNLSQNDHPEQDVIGEILFTQYGPRQLANSYEYEASYQARSPLLD